jgi:hypothetical protein
VIDVRVREDDGLDASDAHGQLAVPLLRLGAVALVHAALEQHVAVGHAQAVQRAGRRARPAQEAQRR